MRKILEAALRHCALEIDEVQHAANGAEGLAWLESAAHSKPFNVILCDLHMPILDGVGFLVEKSRRNLAAGVAVLMITADLGDPHLLRAMAAGAQGHISKPFTLEEMRDTLDPLFRSGASRR